MKNIQILIIMVMIAMIGCENATVPIKKKEYCPPPVEIYPGEWKTPSPYHAYQKVSLNGENLVFRNQGNAYILNLKTKVIKFIDLQSKLPANVRLSSASLYFPCPYNSNRILIHAVTGTDLPDDSIKRYFYGQNLYIVSLDGSEFKRVTPSIFGQVGSPGNFRVDTWLPESTDGNDLILLSYVYNGKGYYGNYKPQTDELLETQYQGSSLMAISKGGKFKFVRTTAGWLLYSLNDIEFHFNEEFQSLDYCSFSPSGKYIALSVTLYPGQSEEERRYQEIWLINVEKFLKEKPDTLVPERIINLRNDFCMYAMMASPCAEFISENALAVAMYKDGDDRAYLWKVSIKGELLEQLTFDP
jgi:hypothetical protein